MSNSVSGQVWELFVFSFLLDRRLRSGKSDVSILWIPKLNIPNLGEENPDKHHLLAVWDIIGAIFCLLPELTQLRMTFVLLTPFSSAFVPSPYVYIQNQHKCIQDFLL